MGLLRDSCELRDRGGAATSTAGSFAAWDGQVEQVDLFDWACVGLYDQAFVDSSSRAGRVWAWSAYVAWELERVDLVVDKRWLISLLLESDGLFRVCAPGQRALPWRGGVSE